MANKIVGIYQITCVKNGKRYIGQSKDIKRRFSQHKRNPPARMIEDFDQYGVVAFDFEILEECAPEKLDKRETFYMNELQPEYNIRSEGHGISEEACEKLRKLQTGRKRPSISRKVKCVETGEVFESITAAAKWCNVPNTTIVMLLKGKGRTAGGYHWIYADENEEAALERIRQMPEGHKPTDETLSRQRQVKLGRKHTPEHSEKIRQSHLGQGWKPSTYEKCCRKVRCVETGEIFSSIKAAAESYNLKPPNISAVLAGKSKMCGGYHWEYVDGQAPQHRPEKFHRKMGKPVRCIETGIVYESVSKAAEAFGVSDSAIGNAANGKREKSCGCHWKFFDGELPPLCEEEHQTISPKLIRCIETGEIFNTLREAAEHVGISTAAISHNLHDRTKTAGGYHWEFYPHLQQEDSRLYRRRDELPLDY